MKLSITLTGILLLMISTTTFATETDTNNADNSASIVKLRIKNPWAGEVTYRLCGAMDPNCHEQHPSSTSLELYSGQNTIPNPNQSKLSFTFSPSDNSAPKSFTCSSSLNTRLKVGFCNSGLGDDIPYIKAKNCSSSNDVTYFYFSNNHLACGCENDPFRQNKPASCDYTN